MKGIALPERTEDFTADPVELFFDLAYVIAFSQLVGQLARDPSWAGAGKAALLFGLLWIPWQQLTWAANAVSGNGRDVRLVFLVATAVCVPMAASTSSALDDGGPAFAVTLACIMLLGFALQTLSAEHGTAFERAVLRWVLPNAVAIVVLVGGAFVAGNGRIVVWLGGLAIVFGAMVVAGGGDWIIRTGHFAERHGLIVIIALGEVTVAIGLPVVAALEAGEGIPGRTVVSLVAAGAFAGLLWWGYFDRPGPALEHRAEGIGQQDRGRYARNVYTWAHAPVVAGIIVAAAAVEEITLHPGHELAPAYRLMLFGGLALMTAGISAAIWFAFRVHAKERIVSAMAIAALMLAGAGVDGVLLLVALDVLIGLTFVVEHHRVEG